MLPVQRTSILPILALVGRFAGLLVLLGLPPGCSETATHEKADAASEANSDAAESSPSVRDARAGTKDLSTATDSGKVNTRAIDSGPNTPAIVDAGGPPSSLDAAPRRDATVWSDASSEGDASSVRDAAATEPDGVADSSAGPDSGALCREPRTLTIADAAEPPDYCPCDGEKPLRVYNIGNSLTWDSKPLVTAQKAAAEGVTYEVGYHIVSNTPLHRILEYSGDPSVAPVQPYGTFRTALPNYEWDAVILQLFPYGEATLESDLVSIEAFIELTRSNPANANTRFYLYTGWDNVYVFRANWLSENPGGFELSSPARTSRQYVAEVLARLAERVTADILVVPVAETLFQMAKLADEGKVPGHPDLNSFYRDHIHMNGTGTTLATTTILTTLLGRRADKVLALSQGDAEQHALDTIIHRTVWRTLDAYPESGVSRGGCWWQ